MGRFFSGIGGQHDGIGIKASAAAVLLSAQGDFTGKLRTAFALSSLRSNFLSRHCNGECNPLGMVDTGLVTFAVYECDEGKRADALAARRMPQTAHWHHPETRMAGQDAPQPRLVRKGHMAGCDAGKGATEPAAGSLAWKAYIRGSAADLDVVATCP